MRASFVVTVTGATGTIGRDLIGLLSKARVPTRALARDVSKAPTDAEVAWVRADLGNRDLLVPALAGTTRLFLLSGNAEGFARVQIHAVRAAEAVGVQHIVKLSALGASDHSKAAIGREHWEVELAIKATAVPYTILRPHSFMQNWLASLAESVRLEGRIYEAIGEGRVPFVDTRDIAEVAFRILVEPEGHTNRTYVLTGGEAVGYHDVAEVLSRILGKRVTYVPQSLEQARARMQQHGMSRYLIESTLARAAYQRAGGPTALVSDHVRELLGRLPRSIHEFLRDHAERFGEA